MTNGNSVFSKIDLLGDLSDDNVFSKLITIPEFIEWCQPCTMRSKYWHLCYFYDDDARRRLREAISNGPGDMFPPVCIPELYSYSESDVDAVQFKIYILDTDDGKHSILKYPNKRNIEMYLICKTILLDTSKYLKDNNIV